MCPPPVATTIDRQSFAKVSYCAIDNILTNLLPAGLHDFFQFRHIFSVFLFVYACATRLCKGVIFMQIIVQSVRSLNSPVYSAPPCRNPCYKRVVASINRVRLRYQAEMFNTSQLAFKRMLSIHTRERMYLPKQFIAQQNSMHQSLMYLSRGELEVCAVTAANNKSLSSFTEQ